MERAVCVGRFPLLVKVVQALNPVPAGISIGNGSQCLWCTGLQADAQLVNQAVRQDFSSTLMGMHCIYEQAAWEP